MKTQTKLCIILGIVLPVFMVFTSCKKDFKEKPTSAFLASADVGIQADLTEEQIKLFLSDVDFYKNQQPADKYLDVADAVQKMQTGTNYNYSDIDTPFFEQYILAFNFSLPLTSDSKYSMTDVSHAMNNISNFIRDKIEDEDDDVNLRLVTSSFVKNAEGGYSALICIGKTNKNSGHGNAGYDYVTDGEHPWCYSSGYSVLTQACGNQGLGVADILQKEGSALMGDLVKFALVNNGIDLVHPKFPIRKYYLDGGADSSGSILINPKDGSPVFTQYDIGIVTAGKPNPILGWFNNNVPVYSGASSIFGTSKVLGNAMQIVYTLDGSLPGHLPYTVYADAYYNWCMPQGLINYYILSVPDVFAAAANNKNYLPMSYDKAFQVNYPVYQKYPDCMAAADMYHGYSFRYGRLKSKS